MEKSGTTRWWILGAMGVILGSILLDETAVGVALPTIQEDLGLSEINSHWVVNIYLLVLAGLAAAAGRLGDIVGTRKLITAGLVVFGIASAVAGAAQDGTMLIVARAVQGVGAAIIFPLSLVLVSLSFDGKERGMALGIYGSVGTSFLALGPLVGGVLTEYLSWRWIFWVNPFVVFAVAVVTWIFWRDPPRRSESGFDWVGLILLVGGLSLTVYGIMEGPEQGWGRRDVAVALGLGLAMLVVFVPAELRARTPMIAVRLFTSPTFSAANSIVLLAQFGKIATFVFGAMYFQELEGWNPVQAGIALLPSVVPPVLLAPFAGKAVDRFGTRLPALSGVFGTALGLAIMGVGMSLALEAIVFVGLLLVGIAISFLFVPAQHSVMTSVEPHMQGQAGGIVLSSQLLGGTLGMAICSTVLAVTGTYAAVFFATAAFAFVVLVFGYLAISHSPPKVAA